MRPVKSDQVLDTLNLQNDKIVLIQKLNEKLMELDGINQQKKDLNQKLLEMIKHVREMQRNLGTADNSKIQDVADS